jgi:glyoxylase-like metal-dependent hydrolase (beta-lactamase superfamily II)
MQQIRVGAVQVTAMVDARFAFPVGSIYPDVGDALGRYEEFLTGGGTLSMICGCSLLQADGVTVLVDTGVGGGDESLMRELVAAGVGLEAIDIVVFTHLHGDHIGWNIDRETGAPMFPNAKYWIPRLDWEHYGAQGGESWETLLAPLEAAGCAELFDDGQELSPSLKLIHTPGHTPGHTSIQITSSSEQAFVLGDAVVDEINLNEPDWANRFDWDDATAADTRHVLIPRLLNSGELIIASHLGKQGLGRFVLDGDRLRFSNL